jgi:7-cyano-7-deazaguanine synthase
MRYLRNNNLAVCIMSGGLDSLCTAAYLTKKNYNLKVLTFSYGQRARHEISQAKKFSKVLKVSEHKIININFMKKLYGNSNVITNENIDIPSGFRHDIVVPIRNGIFITIAMAWAVSLKAKMIAFGAHSDDKFYPDCRPEFIRSLDKSLNLANIDEIKNDKKAKISIWSPSLQGIDKSRLLRIGYDILGDVIFESWSCYSNGLMDPVKGIMHCGECESCINRKIAFNKATLRDKTIYANN